MELLKEPPRKRLCQPIRRVDFTQLLPNEMIEEILSYVKPINKGLFQVNRKLNVVLSNSEKLLSQFQIRFDYYDQKQQDLNVLMNSTRKYTSISIKSIESTVPENVHKILTHYQIKHLKFDSCDLSSDGFYKLLEPISHNLETINVEELSLTRDFECERNALEFDKLTKLRIWHYYNISDCMNFFWKAANLKEVIFEMELGSFDDDIEKLKNYVVGLQNLEKLTLSYGMEDLFRWKDFVDKSNYKLKELQVANLRYFEYKIFYPFLKKQKEQLTYLKMTHMEATIDLMKIIFNDLKMLRKIEFEDFEFAGLGYDLWNLKVNPTIEEITVRDAWSYKKLCSSIPKVLALNLLPNLKSFKFQMFDCSMTEILTALKQVQSLEMLQFEKCQEIPAIEIPQLKKVAFYKSDEEKVVGFLKANAQVQIHHL